MSNIGINERIHNPSSANDDEEELESIQTGIGKGFYTLLLKHKDTNEGTNNKIQINYIMHIYFRNFIKYTINNRYQCLFFYTVIIYTFIRFI